jgi:enoyl-CoA hydratase/carnithine racemase
MGAEHVPDDGAPVILQELTDAGVLVVTLHRPERHNAWTLEMELLYNDIFDRVDRDPDVRAVVLTGAGRSFCPGMDMSVLDAASSGARPFSPTPLPPRTRPLTSPKPVIAAINGACAGIGFNQALMCDLRFAVAGAKFAAAFSRRGLPAEDGVSWLLPRLVGTGHAADLLLSARPIDGAEALAMGLVNRILPAEELLPAAIAYATDLATHCSPWAMAAVKAQLAADQASYVESHAASLHLLAEAKRRPDYREGVLSFLEKRSPRFEGLLVRDEPVTDELASGEPASGADATV